MAETTTTSTTTGTAAQEHGPQTTGTRSSAAAPFEREPLHVEPVPGASVDRDEGAVDEHRSSDAHDGRPRDARGRAGQRPRAKVTAEQGRNVAERAALVYVGATLDGARPRAGVRRGPPR